MQQKPRTTSDRLPLLMTVGLFLVMFACLPLFLRLDDGIDRHRPMYLDVDRMKKMQTAYITGGGSPIEAKLTGGESLKLGGKDHTFVASNGVTLSVRATTNKQFCISAQDRDGGRTQRCSD